MGAGGWMWVIGGGPQLPHLGRAAHTSLTPPRLQPSQIDASYLSPNVNMASRLEAATKQFGVPLLLSGDVVRLLSRAVRARTRLVRGRQREWVGA